MKNNGILSNGLVILIMISLVYTAFSQLLDINRVGNIIRLFRPLRHYASLIGYLLIFCQLGTATLLWSAFTRRIGLFLSWVFFGIMVIYLVLVKTTARMLPPYIDGLFRHTTLIFNIYVGCGLFFMTFLALLTLQQSSNMARASSR